MTNCLPHSNNYVLAFVDLQSAIITTPANFYRTVIKALTAAADISSPLNRFDQPQLRHVRIALDTIAPRRVAILLDEFDLLTAYPAFDEPFFTGLRSLVTGRQLAWVTASYRNLYELGRKLNIPQTSPFFNIFNTSIFLDTLTASEADELVIESSRSADRPFSTEDVVWLQTLSGKMPAFLQKAAQSLFEARRRDPDGPAARQQAKLEFTRWTEHHFDYYWENFNDGERDLLHRFSTSDAPIVPSSYGIRQGNTVLNDLANYGLISRREGRYCINGIALADWISKQTHPSDSSGANPAPVGAT